MALPPPSWTSCAPAPRWPAVIGRRVKPRPVRPADGRAAARSTTRRPRASTSTTTTTTASAAARTATPSASSCRPRAPASWRRSSNSPPRPAWRCRNPRPRRRRPNAGGTTWPPCWKPRRPATSAGCACRRAARALAYLRGRGLTDETIQRFGLGWSGEGRGALTAELAREGIDPDQLVEAGLMRRDDETGRTYDLFFNRVMFPIRDRRGRVISFGGRILGDGQPKYVNGPETALFSKRRNLYALDLAREAVRGGAALVVVEGYMDVIALHQAGFGGAVAPLGTALTEEQLEELWRLSPAPVLCFDGDAAGARAAAARRRTRAAAAGAGPHAAHSPRCRRARTRTRWCAGRAPRGSRPCSTPRARWPTRCTTCCARPAAQATPEQRAAFRHRLEAAARRIPDQALADEYRDASARPLLRPTPRTRQPVGRTGPAGHVRPPIRSQPRPLPTAGGTDSERTRILTAILLRHPTLLHDVDHAYAAMALDPALAALRDAHPRLGGSRRSA